MIREHGGLILLSRSCLLRTENRDPSERWRNTMPKCPTCGAPNPAGRDTCYYCQGQLDQTIQMAAPANPNLRSCPSCDAGVSVFAANCPACGHPFHATTTRPFTRRHGITVFVCSVILVLLFPCWFWAAGK